MMQADKATTPLLNTREIRTDKIIMATIGLFSTFGFFSLFFQQCKKDVDQSYDAKESLMHTTLTIGLLTSVATIVGAKLQKDETENVKHLTRPEYVHHIAKRIFRPNVDPRRFYALGTLFSNIFSVPANAMCFDLLAKESMILQSFYTVLQFTALTVPKDSANAFLAWGVTKGAFQMISLGIIAKNPEEHAATIVANVCFEVAALAAIVAAIKTKYTDRNAPVSDGLSV